jgi:hypothetical protein
LRTQAVMTTTLAPRTRADAKASPAPTTTAASQIANLATGLVSGSFGVAALAAHLLSLKAGRIRPSPHRAHTGYVSEVIRRPELPRFSPDPQPSPAVATTAQKR